ncbi:MAG: type II secretion system protein [Phycisphaerae bacterium]|nr:type II secretion system protein [Phycisphaerae bacterium]
MSDQGTPPTRGGRSALAARPRGSMYAGFTLIEILVVVGIIALLIAVLLPSLRRAREQAWAALCLANLKQQGVGFAAYGGDHKAYLPWVGSFRYSLMEGKYYLGFQPPESHDWAAVNGGLLYPRYVGSTPEVFYCPNNKAADINGPNGKATFLQRYRHPKHTDPQYQNSHNFPISPFGAYGYAIPAVEGKNPRDAGSRMYPEEVIRNFAPVPAAEYPYWRYLHDPAEPDPSFLGPFPQASRGRHAVHAFVSDGFFGGYQGYHLQSYNVLYSDFHARRVVDPGGRIGTAQLGPIRPWQYPGINDAKVYLVWDYFSRNH